MLNMDGGKLGQGCPKGAVGFLANGDQGQWGEEEMGWGKEIWVIVLLGVKIYTRVDHLWIRSSMRFTSLD